MTPVVDSAPALQVLAGWLQHLPSSPDEPGAGLRAMIDAGLDRLPAPGAGRTIERWRALALVAARDLSLAKLYEGHTDALAIWRESGVERPAAGAWAVWAAEPPQARLRLARRDGGLVLQGRKAWCSGAEAVDHALVTAWDDGGAPCLAAVSVRAAGVRVTAEGWQAVGMSATRSVDVLFDAVPAQPVGPPGWYVERAGFWRGGAGVAACWHGAAAALCAFLRRALAGRDEPHAAAHLGEADVRLACSAALLRETAAWIDAHPHRSAIGPALRARAAADGAAGAVLMHAARALGASALCRDAWFARMAADLPVFVRQCHAERDLAALAAVPPEQTDPWPL